MAENQVTIAGKTKKVPQPFLVMATQNPIESEGVFPLPEAQRDRFMMRILVGLPTPSEERSIVSRMGYNIPVAHRCLDLGTLLHLKKEAENMPVRDLVADYAVRLTLATRDPESFGIKALSGTIRSGASPRATLSMVKAAKALAYIRGNSTTTVQEVYDIAYDVLNHRITMNYDAIADGIDSIKATVEVLKAVPAPAGS